MRKIITRKEAAKMSATIQSEGGQSTSSKNGVESGYWDKVIACIPSETVSAYLVIQKMVEQNQEKISYGVSYSLVFIMMLFTILYLRFILKSKIFLQHLTVVCAFVVWAYSLGEPFKHLLGKNYQPIYASLAMILISLVLPFVIDKNFLNRNSD